MRLKSAVLIAVILSFCLLAAGAPPLHPPQPPPHAPQEIPIVNTINRRR
jgi:hypothetical protein